MKGSNIFERVYEIVKQIPEGKVMTYGQIALRLRSGQAGPPIDISARTVGWALHGNRDPKIPCHRVVNKEGSVATNYAFEGWQEQKRRLLSEGITFSTEKCVDLDNHLWNP